MSDRIVKTNDELIDQYFKECENHILQKYSNAVYPIYGANEHKEPEHIGSCFIVEKDKIKYLITAHHVLEHLESTNLYIGTLNGLIPIRGESAYFNKEHKIDMAAIRLESSIDLNYFLTDFIYNDSMRHNYDYGIFLGYPNTRNKKVAKKRKIEILAYLDKFNYNSDIFKSLKIKQDDYFAINYYSKKVVNSDGLIGSYIQPEGISGCPLMMLNITANSYRYNTLPEAQICGVVVEGHADKKLVLALRSKFIFILINKLENSLV